MAGQAIPKHHPVAVVYYLYEDSSVSGGVPLGGLHYVHNGAAAEDIQITDDTEPLVTHVPSWTRAGPFTELLNFCSKKNAKKSYDDKNKQYHWINHHEGTKEVQRLCVCEIVHPYSGTPSGGTPIDVGGHQPITWVEGLSQDKLDNPHNAALKSFSRSAPDACTLDYYHWMNLKPDTKSGESERAAKHTAAFTLEGRSVKGDIYIAMQPLRFSH